MEISGWGQFLQILHSPPAHLLAFPPPPPHLRPTSTSPLKTSSDLTFLWPAPQEAAPHLSPSTSPPPPSLPPHPPPLPHLPLACFEAPQEQSSPPGSLQHAILTDLRPAEHARVQRSQPAVELVGTRKPELPSAASSLRG